MTLDTYLLVALAVLYMDALSSLDRNRRFNLPASALLALAWPITLPIAVLAAAFLTRRL